MQNILIKKITVLITSISILLTYSLLQLTQHIQITTGRISAEMKTVFHARSYVRFIEIKGNLRRKNLHRTNQVFNFPESVFATETM